jgi:hypothetical protein
MKLEDTELMNLGSLCPDQGYGLEKMPAAVRGNIFTATLRLFVDRCNAATPLKSLF